MMRNNDDHGYIFTGEKNWKILNIHWTTIWTRKFTYNILFYAFCSPRFKNYLAFQSVDFERICVEVPISRIQCLSYCLRGGVAFGLV